MITSPRVTAAAETIVLDLPVFTGGYGVRFFEETAREFEGRRPDIRVNLYGNPRIADQVRVRVLEGNPPDATDAALLWPNLIDAGRVADLKAFLEGPNWEEDAQWADSFVPGALDRWADGEAIYGLPFAHAAWTLFYNRAMFRERGWKPPETWDEFFALAETMRAAGIAPLAFPGVYARYADAFLRAAHYNLAGPDDYEALLRLDPGSFADPRFVRAAEVIGRIGTECLLAGWEGMSHTAAQLAFLQGRSGFVLSGSWFVSEMRDRIPTDFELGTINLPVFDDGITDPRTLQTSSAYYFVFAGPPERVRAAVDFFRFLTSRERAKTFARLMDSPTAVRGVPGEAFSPRMRDTARLLEQSPASYGVPPDSPAYLALVNQAMTDARLDLLSGRISAQEFADRLETAAAAERARVERPEEIQIRHAGKATLLLALVGVGVVLLARAVPGGADRRRALSAFGPLRGRMIVTLVLPAFLIYAACILLPGTVAFGGAFFRWDGIGKPDFAGWFNFKWLLFESDVFWYALRNNLFLMIVPALCIVPLSLLLAALLQRGAPGRGFFQACLLFPNLLGGIAATLLWLHAYDPSHGIVNESLVRLGGIFIAVGLEGAGLWLASFRDFPWLAPEHIYTALVPVYIWLGCGFNLVLYLAGMQAIDPELYEAAELDGASRFRQFFAITLPLLREIIVISVVFLVIAGLNTFEMIWLLTAQEPASSTHVLGTWMVGSLFREFQVGRATAIAVVLFVLVLIASALVVRGWRRDPAVD